MKARRNGVKVDGAAVSDFLDQRFVKGVQEEIGDSYFTHFCLIIEKESKEGKEGKDFELIHVVHDSIEDMKNKKFSIKADEPESFEKFYKVVKEFIKK